MGEGQYLRQEETGIEDELLRHCQGEKVSACSV